MKGINTKNENTHPSVCLMKLSAKLSEIQTPSGCLQQFLDCIIYASATQIIKVGQLNSGVGVYSTVL